MIADGILHTTNSSGTGTLNLVAVTNTPGVRDVWGTTRTAAPCSYSVLDTNGIVRETGVGTVNLSSSPAVLTRQTTPLQTWDLSAANLVNGTPVSVTSGWSVIVSPLAGLTMMPPEPGTRSQGTINTRGMAFLANNGNNSYTPTTGRTAIFAAYWPWVEPFDRVRVRFSTAYSGGTVTFAVGIYRLIGPFTSAGNSERLALFDTWGTNPVASTTEQVSNALATPIRLVPGVYGFAMLATFTGGTGTPAMAAIAQPIYPPGIFDTNMSAGARSNYDLFVNSQTTLAATLPALSANSSTSSPPLFLFSGS